MACLTHFSKTTAPQQVIFIREAFYRHYLQSVWFWCKSPDIVFCVLQKSAQTLKICIGDQEYSFLVLPIYQTCIHQTVNTTLPLRVIWRKSGMELRINVICYALTLNFARWKQWSCNYANVNNDPEISCIHWQKNTHTCWLTACRLVYT